jgi:rubredoxin
MCLNPDDTNLVDHEDACPLCGERRADMLEWIDDDRVRCSMCGQEFRPGAAPLG